MSRRGLASTEDSVGTSIQRLEDYIRKRGGRLITAIRNNTNDTRTSGTSIIRKLKCEEKQLYGRFKRLTSKWTWLIKGNLKRETGSLLIAAQNNAIRTNHLKTRIDKMQQNSKCRLYVERDETINPIISECIKLAQKEYMTRHDWVGKVIHWKLCKELTFDHTNKGYMHNPESVLENETHKFLWDFEIQTDHQISGRRPDLIMINKKKKENLQNCGFCCLGGPQSEIKRIRKES